MASSTTNSRTMQTATVSCETTEQHMAALMEQIPHIQELQDALDAHVAAGPICLQCEAVDDLSDAIAELEARADEFAVADEQIYAVLMGEKRRALAREDARLRADVERSRFASAFEARRARMTPSEADRIRDQIDRFKADYAYTLQLCMAHGDN